MSLLRRLADSLREHRWVGQHRRLLKQYRDMIAMLDAELARPAP